MRLRHRAVHLLWISIACWSLSAIAKDPAALTREWREFARSFEASHQRHPNSYYLNHALTSFDLESVTPEMLAQCEAAARRGDDQAVIRIVTPSLLARSDQIARGAAGKTGIEAGDVLRYSEEIRRLAVQANGAVGNFEEARSILRSYPQRYHKDFTITLLGKGSELEELRAAIRLASPLIDSANFYPDQICAPAMGLCGGHTDALERALRTIGLDVKTVHSSENHVSLRYKGLIIDPSIQQMISHPRIRGVLVTRPDDLAELLRKHPEVYWSSPMGARLREAMPELANGPIQDHWNLFQEDGIGGFLLGAEYARLRRAMSKSSAENGNPSSLKDVPTEDELRHAMQARGGHPPHPTLDVDAYLTPPPAESAPPEAPAEAPAEAPVASAAPAGDAGRSQNWAHRCLSVIGRLIRGRP